MKAEACGHGRLARVPECEREAHSRLADGYFLQAFIGPGPSLGAGEAKHCAGCALLHDVPSALPAFAMDDMRVAIPVGRELVGLAGEGELPAADPV